MTSQGKLLDLLWEIAPLAVALGAGVVTYYMTKDDDNITNSDSSGQLEYADYQYSQPGYQQDIQDMGSSQVSSFPMKDYQGNEQLGAIVELLEKNVSSTDPPRWAEQLFQVTNALSDEVKTIKEIVLTNSPQRAPIIKKILTQEEMVSDIKSKFKECFDGAVEKALLLNVSYKTLQSAVQSLHLYINNIVENINVPRYSLSLTYLLTHLTTYSLTQDIGRYPLLITATRAMCSHLKATISCWKCWDSRLMGARMSGYRLMRVLVLIQET